MFTLQLAFLNNRLVWVDQGSGKRDPKAPGEYPQSHYTMLNCGYRYIGTRTLKDTTMVLVYEKAQNAIDELSIALKEHDYSYRMSDSYDVQVAGDKEVANIKRLVEQIGKDGIAMVKQALARHGKHCYTALFDLV